MSLKVIYLRILFYKLIWIKQETNHQTEVTNNMKHMKKMEG